MALAPWTFDELLLAAAQECFAGRYPVDISTDSLAAATTTLPFASLAFGVSGGTANLFHDEWIYFRRARGTATSATANTITDTTLTLATNIYTNGQIRITSGAGIGQIRTVSSNTATQFTVSSNWNTTPSANDTFEFHPPNTAIRQSKAISSSPFAPVSGTVTVAPALLDRLPNNSDMIFCRDVPSQIVIQYLKSLIRQCTYRELTPITLVPDGDMNLAGVTSWTNTGSACTTREKIPSPFAFGSQALNIVTANNTTSGIRSNLIPLAKAETYLFACIIKQLASSGDVIVEIQNTSDSLVIKSVVLSEPSGAAGEQEDLLIWFTFSLAAGAQVRVLALANTASTVSSFVLGPVWLYNLNSQRYSLPSGVGEHSIHGLYGLLPINSPQTDVYRPTYDLRPVRYKTERSSDRVPNINIIPPYSYPWPLLASIERTYPEPTNDLDLITTNKDMIAAGVAHYISMYRATELAANNQNASKFWLSRAAMYKKQFQVIRRAEGLPEVELDTRPLTRIMS